MGWVLRFESQKKKLFKVWGLNLNQQKEVKT